MIDLCSIWFKLLYGSNSTFLFPRVFQKYVQIYYWGLIFDISCKEIALDFSEDDWFDMSIKSLIFILKIWNFGNKEINILFKG